jgi:hypothetical protein
MTSDEKEKVLEIIGSHIYAKAYYTDLEMKTIDNITVRMDCQMKKDEHFSFYPGGTGPDIISIDDMIVLMRFLQEYRKGGIGRPE